MTIASHKEQYLYDEDQIKMNKLNPLLAINGGPRTAEQNILIQIKQSVPPLYLVTGPIADSLKKCYANFWE
jgi:hypothetical protein